MNNFGQKVESYETSVKGQMRQRSDPITWQDVAAAFGRWKSHPRVLKPIARVLRFAFTLRKLEREGGFERGYFVLVQQCSFRT